jgi:hypothetical protein
MSRNLLDEIHKRALKHVFGSYPEILQTRSTGRARLDSFLQLSDHEQV